MRSWRRPAGQQMATQRLTGLLSSLVSCLVLSHAATLRLPIPSIDLESHIPDGHDNYYTTKSIRLRPGDSLLHAGKASPRRVALQFDVDFPSTSAS